MLRSLDLGGDGDEIEAIRCVEDAFGISFPASEWERFEFVGDVWAALLRQRPEVDAGAEWATFAAAIGAVSGAERARIGPGTRLLAEPAIETLKRTIRRWFVRA